MDLQHFQTTCFDYLRKCFVTLTFQIAFYILKHLRKRSPSLKLCIRSIERTLKGEKFKFSIAVQVVPSKRKINEKEMFLHWPKFRLGFPLIVRLVYVEQEACGQVKPGPLIHVSSAQVKAVTLGQSIC